VTDFSKDSSQPLPNLNFGDALWSKGIDLDREKDLNSEEWIATLSNIEAQTPEHVLTRRILRVGVTENLHGDEDNSS